MIEVTVDEVDGVKFLKNVCILEPDQIINGVGVHRVYPRDGLDRTLRLLGLRKVGVDYNYRAYLYVVYPTSYFRFKVTEGLLKVYWRSIRWLYDNARVFKAIPSSQPFSWAYFTPYVWCRACKSGVKQYGMDGHTRIQS